MKANQWTLRRYSRLHHVRNCTIFSRYRGQFVALYITTWEAAPYRELFAPEQVDESLSRDEGFVYILIDDPNEVVGFVSGRPLARDCDFFDHGCIPPIDRERAFYIDALGIDKARRESGFGQTLMHFLISAARDARFSQFVLRTHASVPNPAIALYERLGFERRRTADWQDHGVNTHQARIDRDTPEMDFRIYYYKTIQPRTRGHK